MIPFLIRQYLVPALQSLKCIYSNFCKSLRTISLLGSLRDLVGGVLHKTAVFPIIRAGVTDRYSHMPFFWYYDLITDRLLHTFNNLP